MWFQGEKPEDVTIVEKIYNWLCGLLNWEESKDINALTFDKLKNCLLVHEQKMNPSSNFKEQALKASTDSQSFNRKGLSIETREMEATKMTIEIWEPMMVIAYIYIYI